MIFSIHRSITKKVRKLFLPSIFMSGGKIPVEKTMKHECQQMKEYGYPVQEIKLDTPKDQNWEMELGSIHDPICILFISYCPFCGEKLDVVAYAQEKIRSKTE
jgi:hypothetical protein